MAIPQSCLSCSRQPTSTSSRPPRRGPVAIEVEITPRASGGLRIISGIPANRPCRLEGRNGIGKSVAVRLLALASGKQPYAADPSSWLSLRELVGNTEIALTGLTGGVNRAVLRLTPERWPERPTSEVGTWLGEVTLDGGPASPDQLFDLLDVVHLIGTERLGDTLAQQSDRFLVALQGTSRRLRELEEQRAILGEIEEEVRFLSPERARAEVAARMQDERQANQIRERLKPKQQKVVELQKAAALVALIDAGAEGGRDEEIRSIREQLPRAEAELQRLEAELETAVKALSEGSRAQRAVARQERKLTDLRRQQEQALSRLAELAPRLVALDVEPSAEMLSPEAEVKLASSLDEAVAHRKMLESQLFRSRMTEAQREVYDELRVVLDSALHNGLSEFVLFRLHGQGVSVGELAEAITSPPESETPASEVLREAVALESDLQETLKIYRDRPRQTESVDQVSRELARLRSGVKAHDRQQDLVEAARRTRDAASDQVRALALRLGALNRSGLGEAGLRDAEDQVGAVLHTYGIERDDLSGELTMAQADARRDEETLTDTQNAIAAALESAARRRVAKRNLAQKIYGDPQLSWLREIAGLSEAETEMNDGRWQVTAERLTHIRSVVSQLVRDVEGLEDVAKSGGHEGRFGEALRSLIERDALADLSDPPIATALFDGGDLTDVDLRNATVTWTLGSGEVRTRPLSAFSSGEQALGFMRARLRQVADSGSANRLVFLDEFGAFIAADRRRPLAELLAGNELEELSSQVVVVLPLQVDYEAELEQTTGELRELYESRARQITERGYFTEVFAP